MAHVRTSIRTAIATRLTGLTTTSTRVYPSRIQPLADANLPCLRVYLDDEEIGTDSMAADVWLDRQATLRVECCAKAVSGLDSTLDTMLAEVEAAIGTGDATFGALLKSRPIINAVSVDMDDDLEKPVGILTASYLVHYFTAASNPATAI